MKIPIRLRVNGEEHDVLVRASATLLEVLREDLNLTGTKPGCELGECGACTVLLDGRPVLSCLLLAPDASGHEVLTVEGLGRPDALHPLQAAFAELGAAQCGYCTPGMLMAARALLDSNPSPDRQAVAAALSGNLCRCTGYLRIVDAVMLAARRMAAREETPGARGA